MADRKALKDNQQIDPSSEAWNQLPWRKFEQHVYRIQKRIYRANQRGNKRAVQKLQKLLMKSEAARLLAVRKVTQENQGKNIPGVDGIKSVRPEKRLILAQKIHPKHWKKHKPKPIRRVWVSMPGEAKKRPLGIPTMLERARQALVKAALEPEWEAVFESNSYGFRPGRSYRDAIMAVFNAIRYKPKFVLSASVKGCFANINYQTLMKKMQTYPTMRRSVRNWLKAGILEEVEISPTEEGAQQRGAISLLLANIALHGMENTMPKASKGAVSNEKPLLIRYVDDFVVLHSCREVIEKIRVSIEQQLKEVGLSLHPKKTRMTHTLVPHEGNVGFDFLGFHVQQYPVGKTHTGKNTHGIPLGYKTVIRPSKEMVQAHMRRIKEIIMRHGSSNQEAVIKELNPVIREWTAYYSTMIAAKEFSRCDRLMWWRLWRWAKKRHSNKGEGWRRAKYWRTVEGVQWVFITPKGNKLRRHTQTKIQRHVKVQGSVSPYDGNLLYWSQRLRNNPMLRTEKRKLLQKQQGKCRWCELLFRDGDIIEIDHIQPGSLGGSDKLDNKCLMHLHCHDERHAKRRHSEHVAGVNNK